MLMEPVVTAFTFYRLCAQHYLPDLAIEPICFEQVNLHYVKGFPNISNNRALEGYTIILYFQF